jgi:hypothetical protein
MFWVKGTVLPDLIGLGEAITVFQFYFFMFRIWFGVSKKGSEDALRSTLADFVINKNVPANRKKECITSYKE